MLPKAYEPKEVEERLVKEWQAKKIFASNIDKNKVPFVIVIPPPNITGALHIGHALNCTLQDVLIRTERMLGKESFWVPGTDHGGIATQNVLEKKLAKEQKITRHDLGREKFLEEMWKWYKECGGAILNQFEKMGWAIDLSLENIRFTMDEKRAASVYECFKQWWDKKYIYRGKRMINWCVRCNTALSDIEVDHEQQKGKLYHLHYKGEESFDGIIIATTRPETIFADAAIAVNPKDENYQGVVGKKVRIPLTDRYIPIIADEDVEIGFGSGALKITPAHDPVDYVIGQRHNLPVISVISDKGKLINCPEKYVGMDREAARKEVVKDLEEQGFLVKEEKHDNAVGTCYRCGSVIEPYLSEQWFVKMEELCAPVIEAAEKEELKFHPASWKHSFVNWLKNIQDWCISRQIWWGHRIPVWYCTTCSKNGLTYMETKQGVKEVAKVSFEDGAKPVVSHTKPHSCPDCDGTDFVQDPDVLDTWFSSALWPISTLGWPEKTKELEYFYPTSTMVTGYEILYLWVARMAITGIDFTGKLPFKDVFLNGIIRDKTGKKMSKSLGNVIDPLDMTAKYGTDAVRFSLLMQAVLGKDIPYAEESIVGARNFCNKIYNASRFILMNMGDLKGPLKMPAEPKELADAWLIDRYNTAIKTAKDATLKYNMAAAANVLYHFLWGDFCDWYVELAKARFESDREYVMSILVNVLYGTLKALHPMMPFITEEISSVLKPYTGADKEFLLQDSYPLCDESALNPGAVAKMDLIKGIISAVRTVRSEFNVPPAQKLNVSLKAVDDEELKTVSDYADYIRLLCKTDNLTASKEAVKKPMSATAVYSAVTAFIELEGIIDVEKEKARLSKNIAAARANIANRKARLSDERFVNNAPKEQVEKVKAELAAEEIKLTSAEQALADFA
ncbi:Valyl-tRNA synthetase [Elusimicrobium minutum Pei191]|uniref:Valine--tRNA ligase n=1 Tax=Elusimicrobium minutum (strain Pei191) TaxID=445932 RepID=B2KB56_ELUMP|nr:valine--tRNA ligase [Elusimicrobium minutum]ACC97815.1 Valyl-tRNA synthetase [Elusimicrobium minutum Pei191]